MRNLSKNSVKYLALLVFVSGGVAGLWAQQQAPAAGQAPRAAGAAGAAATPRAVRPPLFFREVWKNTAGGEHPVGPEDVASPNLEMHIYGADAKDLQILGADTGATPVHMWNGLCTSACALTLSDKNNYVDLSGLARIRWEVKVDGFHMLRPLVKLADGTWLVGDHADSYATDWYWSEFGLSDLRWRKFKPTSVSAVDEWVPNVDLSKVDEIGYTDLMQGAGHGNSGWSDVGTIEVYGKPVPRGATVSKAN